MPAFRPDVLVAFGDSLSDTGVVSGLTADYLLAPFPPQPPLLEPGYSGAFSDGAAHSQILPGRLGAAGEGFAVGGARAIGSRTVAEAVEVPEALLRTDLAPARRAEIEGFEIDLGAQVARFVEGDAPFPGAPVPGIGPDDDVAATLFAGLNDLADFVGRVDPADPGAALQALQFVGDLGGALAAQARALADSGLVDRLVLYELPSVRIFPQEVPPTAEQLAAVDAITDGVNAVLRQTAAGIESGRDIETRIVPTGRVLSEVDADPRAFGFAAKGPVYLGDGTNVSLGETDPATGLPALDLPRNPAVADLPLARVQFFDSLHFSGALHATLAAYAEATLTRDETALGPGAQSRATGPGGDLALGGGGADRLGLGLGHDVGLGGRGNDGLVGSRGYDLLAGGSGADRLAGGRGWDVAAGGPGDDTAFGGRGRDALVDGAGDDRMHGQGGADLFVWRGSGDARQSDMLVGGRGRDRLVIVTDEAGRDAALAALDARSAAEAAAGRLEIADLGLETRGIEAVDIVVGTAEALDDLRAPAQGLYDTAVLWGVV